MTNKTKLNIALALLVLFAVLFLVTIEDPAVRRTLPFAAVLIFGYLIYCGVSLLRRSDTLTEQPEPETCGKGCGCGKGEQTTKRQGQTKSSNNN